MNEGGVILYPTDTVWGIGCDATNEEAVRRVYEIKKRADSKAMLVLVDSSVKVDFYVQDVPDVAWDLISSLISLKLAAPGWPLTLADVDTIALRKTEAWESV